uniref:Protein kinase domain-containing protein n=1 Tax=Angiostrongylus cantonensis TaxID=6313 RepID=A0A0K0D5P1_ANGCA
MVIMELLLGPQPLVRPMFKQHTHIVDNMNSVEQCTDDREHAKSVEINEGAEYVRKDYVEIKYDQLLDDTSKSPTSGDESSRIHGGNYRAELKRPDLKGRIFFMLD